MMRRSRLKGLVNVSSMRRKNVVTETAASVPDDVVMKTDEPSESGESKELFSAIDGNLKDLKKEKHENDNQILPLKTGEGELCGVAVEENDEKLLIDVVMKTDKPFQSGETKKPFLVDESSFENLKKEKYDENEIQILPLEMEKEELCDELVEQNDQHFFNDKPLQSVKTKEPFLVDDSSLNNSKKDEVFVVEVEQNDKELSQIITCDNSRDTVTETDSNSFEGTSSNLHLESDKEIDQEMLQKKFKYNEETEKEIYETKYGYFRKKKPGGKSWSDWENVKFYKALKVFGTDFGLMQGSLPNRTRKEIKSKFKREEKNNHLLTDDAVKQHNYDINLLQKELEIVDNDEKDEKKLKTLKYYQELRKGKKIKKSRRCLAASSIDSFGVDDWIVNEPKPAQVDVIDDDLIMFSGLNSHQDPLQVNENTEEILPENEQQKKGEATMKSIISAELKTNRKKVTPKKKMNVAKISFTILPDAEPRYLDEMKEILPNANNLKSGALVFLPKDPAKSTKDVEAYIVNDDDPSDSSERRTMTRVELEPYSKAKIAEKVWD